MKSLFRYPGGKNKVRRKIISRAPDNYTSYREPFVGGGGVFFGITPMPRWINDMHSGVIAVYRALRDRPDEFLAACRAIPCAFKCTPGTGKGRNRAFKAPELERLFIESAVNEEIDEALRYFVLQRCSMCGKVFYGLMRPSDFSAPEGWNVVKGDFLESCAETLQRVRVTQGDFAPLFIESGDEVWIYADPPYIKDTLAPRGSKLYAHSFSMADHERLAETVRRCPHQVLLSYDDDDWGIVRSLYKGFDLIEETWKYGGATTSKKTEGKELLVANYDLRSKVILARIEAARKRPAA